MARIPVKDYPGIAFEKVNSFLLMSSLHRKIGGLGRSMAQRTVCAMPSKPLRALEWVFADRASFLDCEREDDSFSEDTFDSLRALMQRGHQESSPWVGMIDTASLSSKILAYGVFCIAITSCPIPLEDWNFFVLMLGPWWSSAYWVEWVCYDFFRSAFAQDPYGHKSPHSFTKWFPYEFHPGLNRAFIYDRKSFYFCALVILSLYGSMFYVRPQISRILLKKIGDTWGPFFTDMMAKNTCNFITNHKEEILSELSPDLHGEFESLFNELMQLKGQSAQQSQKTRECLDRLFGLIEDLPVCCNTKYEKYLSI